MLKPDRSSYWLYGTILFIGALYSIYICWLPDFYPDYIHSWTQSDRLAIAVRYTESDAFFLLPRTFNLSTTDGITAVDLPLNEYIVSLLMRLLNTNNPAVFRFYCLATGIFAAVCLFKTAYKYTSSPAKASIIVLTIFLSPVVFYYEFSFIPSVFAFNYFLFAIWFAVKAGSKTDIVFSILFITLAALVRTSFLPIFAAFLVFLFIKVKKNEPGKLPILKLSVIVSCLLIIAWQAYKIYLARKYGTQFLNHPLPAQSIEEFFLVIIDTVKRWFDEYCSLLFYVIGLLYFISRNRQATQGLPRLLFLSLVPGVVVFILLCRQFIDHEYYFFESFAPAVVAFSIYAVSGINISKRWPAIILIAALLASMGISSLSLFKKNSPDHYNREHISYNNFRGSEQLLNQYGIGHNAKILVFNAYTSNLPLIQMNRKGFAIRDKETDQILPAIKLPYDYIVVQDEFFPTEVLYHYASLNGLLKRVGGDGHISIFKKELHNGSIPLPVLLGLDSNKSIKFNLATDTSNWINRTENSGYNKTFSPTLQLSYPILKDRGKVMLQFDFDCAKDIPVKIVFAAISKGKTVWHYDYPVILLPERPTIYSLFNIPRIKFNDDTEFRFYLWNEHNEEITYRNIFAEIY